MLQGVEGVKVPTDSLQPTNAALYLPPSQDQLVMDSSHDNMDVESGKMTAIDPGFVGDVSMKDLEHELAPEGRREAPMPFHLQE